MSSYIVSRNFLEKIKLEAVYIFITTLEEIDVQAFESLEARKGGRGGGRLDHGKIKETKDINE